MMKKRNPHQMPQDDQNAQPMPDQAAGEPSAAARTGNGQSATGQTAADQTMNAAEPAAGETNASVPAETAAPVGETVAKADLDKAKEEQRILADRHLRLMAEYDNFRKRSQKEREALYQDAVASVVKEWLPVLDNLARAEQAARAVEGEAAQRIAEGVIMVLRQAEDTLARLNVQPIDCLGQAFDPKYAEAVMHVEDESVGPSTVVEILQKGYTTGDRVIRHCMVKVAN